MNQINTKNIIEKIKDIPGKYKCIAAGTGLALILAFSTCSKNTTKIPKKLGDFEYVDTKKDDGTNRGIYKYIIKKGDYPFAVSRKFNELDIKNGDIFGNTGLKNITLDSDGNKKIDQNKIFNIGYQIYIKAKLIEEKESSYSYDFSRPDNYSYRNNREKGSITRQEKEVVVDGKEEKITLIKDVGLTFYVVQEKDFFDHTMIANGEKIKHCIDFERIRQKLIQVNGLSYLKDDIYQRSIADGKNLILKNKINSFNINPTDIDNISKSDIKKGKLCIPLPIPREERVMEVQEFAYYIQQAINEMEKHPYYSGVIKELLSKSTKEEVLESLLAYTYCESSAEGKDKLGEFELHRWEGAHSSFSFSYFHILMKKGTPGYKARINLGLSEGECYNPKNATKLFLAFWAEKVAERNESLSDYFPLNNRTYEKCAIRYNGKNYKENRYDSRLQENHKKAINALKNYKK